VAGRAGVLALQGGFREHCRALRDVGLDAVEVRVPGDLDGVDGLVIPGGESTTMSKLMAAYGLEEPILDLHRRGGAIFGTCAGMIVLAATAVDGRPDQRYLGLIDIDVRRNAYGRQVSSFEAPVRIQGEDLPMHGVFIRAPRIERVGDDVEAVATLDGVPVAARQGSVMVAAFHPELTTDRRLHARFASLVMRRGVAAA
jgi:pyridoxal 5'-phosphate synthase pdxT subunit